jgi:hypothetical protein
VLPFLVSADAWPCVIIVERHLGRRVHPRNTVVRVAGKRELLSISSLISSFNSPYLASKATHGYTFLRTVDICMHICIWFDLLYHFKKNYLSVSSNQLTKFLPPVHSVQTPFISCKYTQYVIVILLT